MYSVVESTCENCAQAFRHPGIQASRARTSLGSPRKHNQFSSHPIKRSSFPHTYLGESGAIMNVP
jgi:hypothetical protein